MLTALRDRLAMIPNPVVSASPAVAHGIVDTERYLASAAALESLERDPYWPKWDSPWWHMLLLFELGEARRIPEQTTRAMVTALDAMPVKIFPTRPGDIPEGLDLQLDSTCHCALGSIAQVLAACGVDVDGALPWITPWFIRYQMADGGLTCDNDAYTVKDECPSSMVGTIAPFEAMLQGDPRNWSSDHAAFVARGAAFLVERELRLGSSSAFNAAERAREPEWRALCFPRFYFYDILRGLRALTHWMDLCDRRVPLRAIADVATYLCDAFPEGVVHAGRHSYAGRLTRVPGVTGASDRRPASTFALLDATSTVGAPSPWLTRIWAETRAALIRSIEAGHVVG